MKRIIIIALIGILTSCTRGDNQNVMQAGFVNIKTYSSNSDIEIKIVEVDGCEYILTRMKSSGMYLAGHCFIHKANCKNCKNK